MGPRSVPQRRTLVAHTTCSAMLSQATNSWSRRSLRAILRVLVTMMKILTVILVMPTTVDKKIKVALTAGEDDKANNFIDSDNGSIPGTVSDDNGNSFAGVQMQLLDSDNDVFQTTLTDGVRAYMVEEKPGWFLK